MKYESEISKIIHENAKEKFKIGAITESRMREYDEMCLKNPNVKNTASEYNNDNTTNIEQINHVTA